MKTIKLTILFLSIVATSFAQTLVKEETFYNEEDITQEVEKVKTPKAPKINREQPQTLFGDQKAFGGYLAFSFGYKDYDGKAALTSGARLMFVANHYLGIGFGGKGFVSPTESVVASNINHYSYAAGGYGGLYLEPVVMSMKPVHVSFPILLGAGAVGETSWDDNYTVNSPSTGVSSVFFVAEPGVELEFNIAKWFRMSFGASYTLTTDVDGIPNMQANTLEGMNYDMTFKIGWF